MARIGTYRQHVAHRRERLLASLLAALAVLLLALSPAHAQFGGGGAGGGGGQDTIGAGATSGVAVDADGVLKNVTVRDPSGQLARQRIQEALQRLDRDVAQRSKLRKVSLTRLERAIGARLADGRPIDDVMQHLAGLTRLKYVFCYPESGDVVFAGPAEAWAQAPSGRVLGIESGRPVLKLDDLIVALRAFAPSTNKKPFIYCSIDPTSEGLARMQQFLRDFGSRIGNPATNPGQEQFIVNQLRNNLGMQVVTVGGVSPKTHFAQVMVEADYRMKLIGIGLERPPVRLKSYVARANPSQVGRNALQRWYFVPDYQCVRVSDDALSMELVGDGVKLVGEDEVVNKDGSRQASAGSGNRASDAFVNAFTKVYPKLAERTPVYAQLRNCIDMAVAAAFIQHQDYYSLVKWTPGVFLDEAAYPVETLNPPQYVESAVNAIWKGFTLLTPIGGGVQMRPTEAIDPTNLLEDEQGQVDQARVANELRQLGPDQWWWD